MGEIVKAEITIIGGDWQWMGKITKEHLKIVCALADGLSDLDTDAELEAVE